MAETLTASQEKHHLIASDRVEGTKVYNRAGDKLGSIKNFMVGKVSGQAEYAVIEFGGILGIGQDYFPVPWSILDYEEEQGGYVVDLTKEQVSDLHAHLTEHGVDVIAANGVTAYKESIRTIMKPNTGLINTCWLT